MNFQSYFPAIISGSSKIYSLFDWLRKISLGIEVDEPLLCPLDRLEMPQTDWGLHYRC